MGVVDGEVAVADRRCRAHVAGDGLGHVEAAVPRQAEPEGEIHVLEVAEEALVEASGLRQGRSPVEGRGGAGPEDLFRLHAEPARGPRGPVARRDPTPQ